MLSPVSTVAREAIFGTRLLTLPEIFADKFYTVPDYQRGYAWDAEQVSDLLRDIGHQIDDGVTQCHYTGTIVLTKVGSSGNNYHVVDGQQRLTTLTILLRILAEHVGQEQRSELYDRYISRGPAGSERTALRLNSETHQFFEKVILGDGSTLHSPPLLESHKRLINARKLISEWIAHRTQSTSVDDIRNSVENELGFIVYAPAEDSETGVMFEVINNRGKPLSELEKVKNYLIYCSVKLGASSLRSRINDEWSQILGNLNSAGKTASADEGAFLRYCMVVHFKLNKSDSQDGYVELKKKLALQKALSSADGRTSAIETIGRFIDFLSAAALWYARLYGQWHLGLDRNLIAILDQLRAQDRQASVMPLFLAVVLKGKAEGEALHSLLRLIEILNFRVYMARNMTARNDSGQSDLYYYASAYYHDELLSAYVQLAKTDHGVSLLSEEDALEYRLVEFVLTHAPDDLFAQSFSLEAGSAEDMFYWRGLRYFLMSYEQFLQPNKTIQIDKIIRGRGEGRSADYISVEHLWAVENRNSAGENDRLVDRFEKRRLGNFALLELRLNIQGSNDNLEYKIKRYLNGFDDEPSTDFEHVRRVGRHFESASRMRELLDCKRTKNYYLSLHRRINDLQEQDYIDFALTRWSVGPFLGHSEILTVLNQDAD